MKAETRGRRMKNVTAGIKVLFVRFCSFYTFSFRINRPRLMKLQVFYGSVLN